MNLQNLVDEVLTKIFSLAESCLGDLFKNKKGVNFTVSIELVFLSFSSSSSSTEISTLPPPLPPTTTTMQLAEERRVEGSVTNSSCHFMCILLHVTCMLVLVLSILVLAVGLVIGICIH